MFYKFDMFGMGQFYGDTKQEVKDCLASLQQSDPETFGEPATFQRVLRDYSMSRVRNVEMFFWFSMGITPDIEMNVSRYISLKVAENAFDFLQEQLQHIEERKCGPLYLLRAQCPCYFVSTTIITQLKQYDFEQHRGEADRLHGLMEEIWREGEEKGLKKLTAADYTIKTVWREEEPKLH